MVTAIALRRATMRNIRQNLVLAFVYNLAGIPLAAGVLYPFFEWQLSPVIAAAAMALSSLSVVTNANRRRGFRAPSLPEVSIADNTSVDVTVETSSREQNNKRSNTMPSVKDPVCGMDIDPNTASASEKHEGQRYYFCSHSCHQRFKKNPEQYAKAA